MSSNGEPIAKAGDGDASGTPSDFSVLEAKLRGCILDELSSLRTDLDTRLASIEQRLARAEAVLASAGPLRVGDAVRIEGLDNVSHLHLNGKKAKLQSWEGPGGRWVVQVLQTGHMKSLKLENLRRVAGPDHSEDCDDDARLGTGAAVAPRDGGGGLSAGDVVEIRGLRRAGQLNGARGEILGWDDEGGRWLVKLNAAGQRKRLRTCNLRRVGEAVRFPPGSAAAARYNVGGSHSGQSVAPEELEPGLLVRLHGLGGAKKLNGTLGRVQRKGDAGRWVVQMLHAQDSGEKSFKEDNLAVAEAAATGPTRVGQVVRIVNLASADDLDGLRGETLNWDPERNSWVVRLLETDEDKPIPPDNLSVLSALRRGRSAIIEGLERATELNGRTTQLMQWSASDSRWLVRVGGEEKRLRPRHLRAVQEEDAHNPPPSAGEGTSAAAPPAGSGAEEEEVLGSSSADEEELPGKSTASAVDVLCEGASVKIEGAVDIQDGQRGVLVRWEDVGGPFGQWVVEMADPGGPSKTGNVNPSCLSLTA